MGETFLEARFRAIVSALLVNSPLGGWVESVLTLATQRFFLALLAFGKVNSQAEDRTLGCAEG